MQDRSDAELVTMARGGDKSAFGDLIDRHQPMAQRVATRVVGHGDFARELTQEALLQAYLSLDRLRDGGRFSSWLYGIVLNVCRSHLRDQTRAPLSLDAMIGGLRFEAVPFTNVEPDPQEVAEARELHGLVLRAVDELSPRNRTATLLFYYDQLSVREVAAVLDISVTAAKGRLHKARSQLRERLSPLMAEARTEVLDEKEEKKMVSVTIADVVSQEEKNEETGLTWTRVVVVLLDAEGRRVLPIWIGEWEGTALAMGLRDFPVPRPMTHRFTANLLDALGAELVEVRIEAIRESTFYAVAKLRTGDKTYDVDARPSDAMALAAVMGAPIFAAEEILEQMGRAIPEQLGDGQTFGAGLDSVIKRIEDFVGQTESQARSSPAREEVREASYQELWSHLFGSAAEEADPA